MWNATEYATTGKGHLRTGVPCQDKVKIYQSGEVTVIALADGAGSAKYSHFGAETVIENVSSDLGEHFDEYFSEQDGSVIRQRLFERVIAALDQTQKEKKCSLKDLSSTLLAVAVSGSRYFIAHIGDGVIGYLKDGEMHIATKPDNGEHANETFFTTSPNALLRMRILKGRDESIGGFVLMSDGTEAALYDKRRGVLSPGIRRIMQMTALCPERAMKQLFHESFRENVTSLTQDDCSISVLVRTELFSDYFEMGEREKMSLLQIKTDARAKNKRMDTAEEILKAAKTGATAAQIAKRVHIKPKHIRGKLNRLIDVGLIEKNNGIYRSGHYEITTDLKSGKDKEEKIYEV